MPSWKKMIPKTRKSARVTPKSIRLIDPELRDRGDEKEQRDDEVLRRLRLLSAEDEEREPGDEGDENGDLHPERVLEVAEHFVRGAAPPLLARGEALS